jgi:hypothetical protein
MIQTLLADLVLCILIAGMQKCKGCGHIYEVMIKAGCFGQTEYPWSCPKCSCPDREFAWTSIPIFESDKKKKEEKE